MGKVFFVKQETKTRTRFCLNCGRDISDKRKGTQFCCKTCYNTYNEVHKRRDQFNMSL